MKPNVAAMAAAMLSIGSGVYDFKPSQERKGRFRDNYQQKRVAMTRRVEKRRAKNKMAKQSRRKNR